MKFLFLSLIVCLLFVPLTAAQDVTPQPPFATPPQDAAPEAPPALIRPLHGEAVTTVRGDGLVVEVFFATLAQGQSGWIRVTGDGGYGLRAYVAGASFDLIPAGERTYYGLIAAGLEADVGVYDLIFEARRDDFESVESFGEGGFVPYALTVPIEITNGNYLHQAFNIPESRAHLLDGARENAEYDLLTSVVTQTTPRALWEANGFVYPLTAEITSPFGAFRTLNGFFATRHTGWDLRAAAGTPITPMADGIVAFNGTLDIRGGHLVIDHGYGVFSGYSHLAEMLVDVGETVTVGQVIAMSGGTGRVNGPHLHWEVTVNGQWVDALQFVTLWTPNTALE